LAEPKKKTDKVVLPESVDTTPAPTQEPQQPVSEPLGLPPEIAKTYEGKSIEEVIKMHREAEKRLGGLKDEVGKERTSKSTGKGAGKSSTV
jgi:hypothetical protein